MKQKWKIELCDQIQKEKELPFSKKNKVKKNKQKGKKAKSLRKLGNLRIPKNSHSYSKE